MSILTNALCATKGKYYDMSYRVEEWKRERLYYKSLERIEREKKRKEKKKKTSKILVEIDISRQKG